MFSMFRSSIGTMAALSHLKNKKESRMRIGLEKVSLFEFKQCSPSMIIMSKNVFFSFCNAVALDQLDQCPLRTTLR